MKIEINPEVYKELAYMVELHQRHGSPNPQATVPDLVAYILAAIADGSRRPGSWERDVLEQMGLVADCDEHHQYRGKFGPPS